MDFAGLDAQADIVVGAHAGKRLADADELQSDGSLSLRLDKPRSPSTAPTGPAGSYARTAPTRSGASRGSDLRGAIRRPISRFPDPSAAWAGVKLIGPHAL